jgi:hypothetical protein
LDTVWEGLEYLCEQVERVEMERVKPDKNFAYVDFGSSPGDAMVCDYFLWYASAFYNFLRVFEKAFSPSEALKDQFKEVIKWRHKVAAHTAWASPRSDDNPATQDMSILLFPEFNFRFDGHFEVGGMRIGPPAAIGLLTDDESRTDEASCADWQWGLVRTHERLKEIVKSLILIKDITERGAEIRMRLREFLARHEYTSDNKTVLVIGAVDQALEYHEAIWLLRARNLNGSALAMVRLVYDAMFRALWLRAVATEDQVEQASRDELNWLRIPVRDDIKRVYFGTPEDPKKAAELDKLFDAFKQLWKILSSYTHSGALQLARRFTFDEVKPSYTEHEIAQALSAATEVLLFCSVLLFKSIDAHEEADDTVTMRERYRAEFDERLNKGQ